MRTRTLLVSTALMTALGLAGCAEKGEEPSNPKPTPTTGAPTGTGTAGGTPTEDARQVVEITVEGGEVTPSGRTVEVAVDEPVVLDITADEAGELHVHTSPEQEVAYEAGNSRHRLTLDRPGVYEVESHDLHLVVVKLQAS